MTKKYRVKIDLPMFDRGDIFKSDGDGWCYYIKNSNPFLVKSSHHFDPKDWPQYFEPLPDPVEKVELWLARIVDKKFNSWEIADFKDAAKKLLDAGLDPERLG